LSAGDSAGEQPTFTEAPRSSPVIGRPDVLVVGAGSAGVAAAVASARSGADTWLIERSGTVGGLASVGLINLLLTLDDGEGTQVVAGLCQEVVDRLEAAGQARYPAPPQWGSADAALVSHWRSWGLVWGAPESVRYSVAYDPDAFVDVCYELLAESGARLRLHTHFAACVRAGGPERPGPITAVLVESKRGREAILPRVVVDASGDGDVAASAGVPFELVPIPPHLWFRVGGVDPDVAAGAGFFLTTAPGRVLVPWGPHPVRVDATDPDSMTAAELACRLSARESFGALRRDHPAFGGAWLDGYAGMLGITESRRMIGDHVLAREEAGVAFPDSVATTGHWTRRGAVFHIPLRSMTTSTVPNLVVAGRCISTTRYVHQATKEIPAAMATGHAAGVAAAMAAATDSSTDSAVVSGVDRGRLRARLRAEGALVGGPDR